MDRPLASVASLRMNRSRMTVSGSPAPVSKKTLKNSPSCRGPASSNRSMSSAVSRAADLPEVRSTSAFSRENSTSSSTCRINGISRSILSAAVEGHSLHRSERPSGLADVGAVLQVLGIGVPGWDHHHLPWVTEQVVLLEQRLQLSQQRFLLRDQLPAPTKSSSMA